MVQRVPACGASQDGLHGRGIQGSLSCVPLLVPTGCRWALRLVLSLGLGFVVDPQQQTVVHNLKAFQNLTWNIHVIFQKDMQKKNVSHMHKHTKCTFSLFSSSILQLVSNQLVHVWLAVRLCSNKMPSVNLLLHNTIHPSPRSSFLTRQSLCRVLTRAPYVSWSRVRPSGTSFRKSRSLKVGLDFSLSFLDARLLYVEPFRSNLRCMRTEHGKILFITTTLMFLPPHWTQ